MGKLQCGHLSYTSSVNLLLTYVNSGTPELNHSRFFSGSTDVSRFTHMHSGIHDIIIKKAELGRLAELMYDFC